MQGGNVLVTGGCGYIGSHTLLALIDHGFNVIVLDNLVNSSAIALERVVALSCNEIPFVHGDVRNSEMLSQILEHHKIDAVIHFAGLKAVGESVSRPIDYYDVNVGGTISLVSAMERVGVTRLVFSSSATVYGSDAEPPYRESMGRGKCVSPYGASKAMVEQILEDKCLSNPEWSVSILRYFNPIGAHKSGVIGEDPMGIPNNLMPFIAQVAIGHRESLSIYGGDYATPDGTCRRDYLHVLDLSDGHVNALQRISPGCHSFNLGTGVPVSVLEMISCFEAVTGVRINYKIIDRRLGDLPEFWANSNKALNHLGWKAQYNLEDMVEDTWRWQLSNPSGYLG